MAISAPVAADLASLTGLLNEPDVDLESELRALSVNLNAAISSYLAMTVTISLDGHRISFTVLERADTAQDGPGVTAASLLIPLSGAIDGAGGNTLVVYSSTAGAFVDLAADLSYALGVELSALVLDAHLDGLDVQSSTAGMAGLAELTIINQALGVLLARGYTPNSGRLELQRLADLDGGRIPEAAASILGDVDPR